jgi:hypothetical protein
MAWVCLSPPQLRAVPGKRSVRMEKPKIYLETTMFSFYYEERTHGRYQELNARFIRFLTG